MRLLTIITLLLLCSSCGTSGEWRLLPDTPADQYRVYLVSHGWHTGIVIAGDNLGDHLGFLNTDAHFGGGRFYEFGWGDKGFYQAQRITPGLAVRAILWPTDSVMHVVAMPDSPDRFFPDSRTIEISVSGRGLAELTAFIAGSFARDDSGGVFRDVEGLYGTSWFYQGAGSYYLTKTCNSWSAEALHSAGLPVSYRLALTADAVMEQAEAALDRYRCCAGTTKRK